MMEAHELDLDETRDVIMRDMLGEQPLPLGAAGDQAADRRNALSGSSE